jgi:hypothetical protein
MKLVVKQYGNQVEVKLDPNTKEKIRKIFGYGVLVVLGAAGGYYYVTRMDKSN